MRVQKKNKAFAYRVPIGDYNYLQCRVLLPYAKCTKGLPIWIICVIFAKLTMIRVSEGSKIEVLKNGKETCGPQIQIYLY